MKSAIIVLVSITIGYLLSFILNKNDERVIPILVNRDLVIHNPDHPSSKGIILNKKAAVDYAKILFGSFFPVDNLEYSRIEVNLENGVWHVKGVRFMEKGEKGGHAFVKIRKSDGAVLLLIHEK